MEKINVAELLKDCPEGMELDCTLYEKPVKLMWVSPTTYSYPINIQTPGGRISLTEYGCYTTNEHAKCVIFPKGKTTWEGFKSPFKDGDIIADNHKNIAIYKGRMNCNLTDYYCGYRNYDSMFLIKQQKDGHFGVIEEFHFANEEEKQKLFRAIKDNGYKWNPDTKTLEKLEETKFKDGDILTTILGSIFILKESYENTYSYGCYVALDFEKAFIKSSERFCNKEGCCLATEDEKKEMFDAIQAKGYKWNSETKTLEKLIKPIFKDGDVVVCCKKYPFIYSREDDNYWYCHCGVYIGTNEIGFGDKRWIDKSFNIRLANNEEKEKLFQLIRENGYKWNAETKKLEKLLEPKFKVGDRIVKKNGICGPILITGIDDEVYYSKTKGFVEILPISEQDEWELALGKFDISTLKPFDKVLVRDDVGSVWHIQLFENFDITHNYPYVCIGYNNRFKQCIPYEGNEHLLGNK